MKSLVNLNSTKIWLISWTYGHMDGLTRTAPLLLQSFQFSVVKQSATRSYSSWTAYFCAGLNWGRAQPSARGIDIFSKESLWSSSRALPPSPSESSRRMWIGWTLHGGLMKQIVAVRIKNRGRTFKFPRDEVVSWKKVMRVVSFYSIGWSQLTPKSVMQEKKVKHAKTVP